MENNNILLICPVPLKKQIAGPFMRYYHFFMELEKYYNVRMLIPEYQETSETQWYALNRKSINEMGRWADVIIVQGTMLFHYPQIKRANKPIVIDLYDPFILENLEYRGDGLIARLLYEVDLSILRDQLYSGDYYICSNTRQLDFWIGCLSVIGKINVETYSQMKRPTDIIGIVPIGIPSEEPQFTSNIRESVGISGDDFVVIWAGGLWKWLDVECLLKAFVLLKQRDKRIKLLIMGGNLDEDLKRFCEREGLLGETVYLTDWVPYQERHQFLMSADVGVITHFDNLETKYSHRTRVLDHVWCNLPTISTCGDYLSEWLHTNGAGLQCQFEDSVDLADRILELYEDPIKRSAMINQIHKIKHTFYWEHNMQPLIEYCKQPIRIKNERAAVSLNLLKPVFLTAKRLFPIVKRIRRLITRNE